VDIAYEIKKIIASEMKVPIERLNADTRLEDLGVESIDIIEIVFEIEQKFDIEIPLNANENMAEEFKTVGAVAKAVESAVQAKN